MGAKLNPSYWTIYLKQCEHFGETRHPELAGFAARYRLAKAFTDMNAPGIGKETLAIYNAAMNVSLSFTALERLEKAIDQFSKNRLHRHPVIVPIFHDAIVQGDFDELLEAIKSTSEAPHRKWNVEHLEAMRASSEANLRPLAEGIRNMMFHGTFTPTSSGLRANKKTVTLLNMLAAEVLASANDEFTLWVKIHGDN